jgi:hypothetical protein
MAILRLAARSRLWRRRRPRWIVPVVRVPLGRERSGKVSHGRGIWRCSEGSISELPSIGIVLCSLLRISQDLMRRLDGLELGHKFNLIARIAIRMVLASWNSKSAVWNQSSIAV